jgi:hypothetical protein
MLDSSSPTNGFDIILKVDHNTLKPNDANIIGTILGTGATTIVKCVGGSLKTGSQCSSQAIGPDAADTIELAVAGATTSPPTTGLLFTAIFDIVVATTNTPIGFQTGCTHQSAPGVCVSIGNGSNVPDQEAVQSGQFSNLPYYSIDASPVSMSITATAPGSSSLTLTSLNNFNGIVQLTATGSVPGLTGSLTPFSNLKISTTNPVNSTTVNVSVDNTVLGGIYNLTIAANSGVLKNSVTLRVTVIGPNFTLNVSPNNLVVNGSSKGPSAGNFTLILTSVFSFAGTISLTLTSPVGTVASLNLTTVKLLANGSNSSSRLTVKANNTNTVTITATGTTTSGAVITHTAQATLTVRDFTISTNPQTLTIAQNQSRTVAVNIGTPTVNKGIADFAGTVNITLFVSVTSGASSLSGTDGLTVGCVSQRIIVPVAGNSTTCSIRGNLPGTYNLIITGKSGSYPSHAATTNILVQGPDFAILPASTVQTVTIGSNATFTLKIQDILGLKATVSVATTVQPTGPKQYLNASTVPLTGSANSTVILTLTTDQTLPAGPYTVTITGSATIGTGSTIHTVTVLLVITGLIHPPQVILYTVTVSPTSANTGTSVSYFIQVLNNGTTTQTVTVDALVGDTVVDAKNITIAAGMIGNVTLTWKTSNYSPGPYILGAKVLAVPGQVNTAGNLARVSTPFTLNSSSSGPLSTQTIEIIGAAAAAIIILAGLAVYLRAIRKRRTTT